MKIKDILYHRHKEKLSIITFRQREKSSVSKYLNQKGVLHGSIDN